MEAGAFGPELRRWRLRTGLSLSKLAKIIHYDKGYLSKIERELSQPSEEFVRDCDAALKANGALAALRRRPPPQRTPTEATGIGMPNYRPQSLPMIIDSTVVVNYEAMFAHVRSIGQATATATALNLAELQRPHIAELADACGPAMARLHRLSAQYAEFIGWMYQEQGDTTKARMYTELARTGSGCRDLAAYAWVRHAEISLSTGDSEGALRYAAAAYADARAAPRVRPLAAHRIAQAHALQRKAYACHAALGEARRLLEGDSTARGLDLGTSTVHDIGAATAGWCDYELGQHAEAVEHLSRALARIPAISRRARGVFGGRLSLSYAAMGDADRAVATGRGVLEDLRHTRSAATTAELRTLKRYLLRWQRHAEARELDIDLTAALRSG